MTSEERREMRLGEKVRIARDTLTMREFAKIVGVSNSSICRVENKDTCSLEALVKLAKALNTTTDDLLGVSREDNEHLNAIDALYADLRSMQILMIHFAARIDRMRRHFAIIDREVMKE